MPVEALSAPPYAPPAAQQTTRPSAISLAVIAIFGFLLPVMRLVDFAGASINLSAADLLILPVLFLLRRGLLRTGSLGYWIFALWMLNLLSWALSASVLIPTIFLRECIKLAVCYIYAFAGFAIGAKLHSHNALVRGMVWSAIPMAAVGIVAFFTGRPSWFIADSRVAGTLGDANAFGIYLAMVLPLVASVGIGWLVIPLFIGAGVVSFSRSGLAAIGSSMALVTLRLGLKRYLAIAVPCIVAFVAVYLTSLGASTVGLRIADYQGSLEERRGLWGLAARVAADHPVLGIGKGNWEAVSASPIIPHNTFLSVMVDGGLIGFAVFIIPIGVWLARGMRRAAAMPWAIAVFAGLVGGLAVSLDNFRPFWIAVGVLAAHLTASENYQGAVTAARASRRSPLNRHWR